MSLALSGLLLIGVGYGWARLTFDTNIESNDPNLFAGMTMVVGIAVIATAILVSKYGADKPKRKSKSKK